MGNKPDSISDELRIGVYVCHCGKNIAGSVNCEEVAKFASTLPNVVLSKQNLYTCSEPGQETIKKDIAKHNLNRIVVASCTPRLHEPTFRQTCTEAGLNKYLFEMANIREQCSWVHIYEPEKATEKARDLVHMAVARVALLKPQKESVVPVTRKTLVIGGGIAGIQAALDLANTGYKVYLVEKNASIGGRMAQIDKTFPTMDCSICILAPKMSDIGKHPNIELLANSEVMDISGYIGNFMVKVKKKSRYVTKDCTACGDCVDVCPVEVPNEFELGLTYRKAIYIPFAQAVPPLYMIDEKSCIGLEDNTCAMCQDVCGPNAINFLDKGEETSFDVGTIIVATGLDVFDPVGLIHYGYLRFANVITSMEFERLINPGGPTGGELVKPSDMTLPKSVVFIQCIGSRSCSSGNPYCSNVCCMNTIKDALIIKEHWPDIKIHVFYLDVRSSGKGFEDLFRRAKKEGVVFIRGLPADIFEDSKSRRLYLIGENTLENKKYKIKADLVVLSVGLEPREDSDVVKRQLRLSKTTDGFFMEAHPKLKPVDTPTGGVFLAGCAEAPKDIKDSVTQASAAAARAGILMAKGNVSIEAITPLMYSDKCIGCGLCSNVCPYSAITIDKDTKKAIVIEAACAGCGTCGAECPFGAIEMRHFTDEQLFAQIDTATEKNASKKILAFCCNWCSYAGADFAGVNRIQYPSAARIIRTMCSGRIALKFIERAFARGVGAVLIAGCHLNDCHYINANYQTKKRIENMWKKMDKLELDKKRLRLAWISAAEGQKFATIMKEMQHIVDTTTNEEIKKTVACFASRDSV